MPRRKKALKRMTREQRAKIIAVADKQGLTAMQVEKKFGVSRWTYYGWRKRRGTKTGRVGRPARRAAAATTCTCNCPAEIQAMLPGLIRQELTQALRDLLIGAAVQRRGRRRKR